MCTAIVIEATPTLELTAAETTTCKSSETMV
jgi:hypothetical protein